MTLTLGLRAAGLVFRRLLVRCLLSAARCLAEPKNLICFAVMRLRLELFILRLRLGLASLMTFLTVAMIGNSPFSFQGSGYLTRVEGRETLTRIDGTVSVPALEVNRASPTQFGSMD
jgi:hypothetical protein